MPSAYCGSGSSVIVSVILAIAENGIIGKHGRLPWHLPEDLKNFRRLTLDKPILMGRCTWESLPGPLPRRRCIVVTGTPQSGDCECVETPEEGIALCANDAEIVVIGGVSLFTHFLPLCDRLYLTRVEASVPGDTQFAHPDLSEFELLRERRQEADARHAHSFVMQEFAHRVKRSRHHEQVTESGLASHGKLR